jgi:hypothetical protein
MSLVEKLSDIIFPIFLLNGIHETLELIQREELPKRCKSYFECPTSASLFVKKLFLQQTSLPPAHLILASFDQPMRFHHESTLWRQFQSIWVHVEKQRQTIVDFWYQIRSIAETEVPLLVSFLNTLGEGIEQLSLLSQSTCIDLSTYYSFTECRMFHQLVLEHVVNVQPTLPKEYWTVRQSIEFMFITQGSTQCDTYCACGEAFCATALYEKWKRRHQCKIPWIALSFEHQDLISRLRN